MHGADAETEAEAEDAPSEVEAEVQRAGGWQAPSRPSGSRANSATAAALLFARMPTTCAEAAATTPETATATTTVQEMNTKQR